jgi:arsenate reductase
MKHTIFGIKNCDTMKKAFAWLDAQGIAYDCIDYKKAGVVEYHIDSLNERIGWETLLNRKGLTWKKLSVADRSNVDDAKALALMKATPHSSNALYWLVAKKQWLGLHLSPIKFLHKTQNDTTHSSP